MAIQVSFMGVKMTSDYSEFFHLISVQIKMNQSLVICTFNRDSHIQLNRQTKKISNNLCKYFQYLDLILLVYIDKDVDI